MRIRRARPALLAGVLLLSPAVADTQVWEVDNRLLELPLGQDGANFGFAVATGDFDGNQIQDLVVGAPRFDNGTIEDAGVWFIYWGSSARDLVLDGAYVFGTTGPFYAGSALASGDFDGDGRDEIAIGAPATGVGPASFAGIVVIQEYDATNVFALRKSLSQDDVPLTTPENNDRFGSTLAVGDFDGDGFDDLAVGTPAEDWGSDLDTGVVHVFYGSASEWLRTDNAVTILSPNRSANERFGFALAVGNFDSDGYDDLAVGAPNREVDGQIRAGAVEIYHGSPAGILTAVPRVLDDGDFAGGAVAADEYFGHSLAAGNFNQTSLSCYLVPASCYADLAIGVPGQTRVGIDDAGKVMIAYGTAAGLTPTGGTYLSANLIGAAEEADDLFGWSLAAGRLDAALLNYGDLAIGTPHEDLDTVDAGVAHLVFGSGSGLNGGLPAQLVSQRAGFEIAPAAANDMFGSQLAVADLDGDGWGDLIVGVPDKRANNVGVVQVLYGGLFADGFESGVTTNW